MKNKCIKRVVALVLALSMVCGTGCAKPEQKAESVVKVTPMEKEESDAYYFDYLGGKDVMPIGGYYGPNRYNWCWDGNYLPDLLSDEIFQLIADSGINLLTYMDITESNTPGAMDLALNLCEKYNIACFSTDGQLVRRDNPLVTIETAEKLAARYQYDAWSGLYFIDEPATPYFYPQLENRYVESYTGVADVLHNQLNQNTYLNMLPLTKLEWTDDYEKYIDEVVETLNPRCLMWDEYPFAGDGVNYEGDMQTFITAMSIQSHKAKEHGLPFWLAIATGAQFGSQGKETVTPYWPNEAQFDWNINTCLSYGAKGLFYYTVIGVIWDGINEEGKLDPYRNGLIGAAGNKNQWFYYAQNINKHIASIDHVLMNSVHKGVIIKGEQAKKDFAYAYDVIDGEKFQELQAVDGHDVMIGCFNYNGKTALYVTNYNMEYAQHITLDFNTEHNLTVTQLAETSYVKGDSITLDMAAGEGVLLVIE